MKKNVFCVLTLAIGAVWSSGLAASAVVSHDDPRAFHTIQAAVDAMPDGGEISVAPGTYREKIKVPQKGIFIRGMGRAPADTVIVYGDGAITAGGTFRSATLDAKGDNFRLDNLTVQNDWSLDPNHPPSQAVALAATGDKDVFTRVRLLGAQDTLYANKGPNGRMARQFFSDCYVEGHVDFIFGNAKAYFQRCELHGIAHSSVMFTAQSKSRPEEDSAYVFDHCILTADKHARDISLGRAWRPYATVVFLNTAMNASVIAEGWREWTPGKTDTLKTAYYAEYNSTGIGASPTTREPYSRQLRDAEAKTWSAEAFFAGDVGWLPPNTQ